MRYIRVCICTYVRTAIAVENFRAFLASLLLRASKVGGTEVAVSNRSR